MQIKVCGLLGTLQNRESRHGTRVGHLPNPKNNHAQPHRVKASRFVS